MAKTNSNAFLLNVIAAASGVPTWRVNQSVNEWREIAGSAMSNFPPAVNPGRAAGGPYAKIDTWCGLCIDTRSNEVWSLANGGHNDYHGNEVMKFTLGANSPVWVEVTPSNTAAQFTIPWNAERYSNDKPTSSHSYGLHAMIETRNRAIRFGNGSGASIGNGFGAVDGFNVLTATGIDGWDSSSTYPNLPVGATGQSAIKDPLTEDVYVLYNNNNLYKWTNATNTWSNLGTPPSPVTGYYVSVAFDSTRRRIFFYGFTTNHTYDVTTSTWAVRTVTGAAVAAPEQGGMTYIASADAFYHRQKDVSGGAVTRIDASTFAATSLTTTGGSGVVATAGTGIYNRWLYAPTLGGIVYFPRYTSNAWFLRIH